MCFFLDIKGHFRNFSFFLRKKNALSKKFQVPSPGSHLIIYLKCVSSKAAGVFVLAFHVTDIWKNISHLTKILSSPIFNQNVQNSLIQNLSNLSIIRNLSIKKIKNKKIFYGVFDCTS